MLIGGLGLASSALLSPLLRALPVVGDAYAPPCRPADENRGRDSPPASKMTPRPARYRSFAPIKGAGFSSFFRMLADYKHTGVIIKFLFDILFEF
jgi:hypothetical protein